MTEFLRYTPLTADSNSCNSLEGITSYADQDVCYIQSSNQYYRFFAADTTTPDGNKVIAPADVTPPAPGRWFQQGPPGQAQPNTGHPADLSSCDGAEAAALCVRAQGVFASTTVVNFTLDLAAMLAALEVPDTGDFQVAARLHLIGLNNINGNTPTLITQLYTISIDITNGNVTGVIWNTTFETAGVPPGYLATPGTAAADNLQVTDISFSGTEITVEWTATVDTFLQSLIPGSSVCGDAVCGEFA